MAVRPSKSGAGKRSSWIDRAELLWLNTHDFLPAKPVPGAECRPLGGQDFEKLSLIKDFEIDERMAKDFDRRGFVGIGMFVDQKLVGLCVFTTGNVPAAYNRRGDQFNGADIILPPGTRCMIKAIVLPDYRGQRLHSAMVRYAIDHFGKDTVHTFVTAYDLSNKAFLASCKDQGFERVGKFTEFSVLGKSFYRLPKPIDSVSGDVSTEEDGDGAIIFQKAA